MKEKLKYKSLIMIGIMVLIGIIYPYISPYDPNYFGFDVLLKPSFTHLLGTDEMGHDIFSILLVGFRITIGISLISSVITTFLGTILAVISAYYRGVVDEIIRKTTDFMIIIPEIVMLLFLSVYLEPTIKNTIISISFFSWSKVTRIIRAKAITVMDKEKIKYTLLLKGNLLDIFKKLWPELYPSISTMFILQCSKAAVYESTLSFFGIGDPLVKSWGKMIKMALNYEGIFNDGVYIWYLLPPIICICIFVTSLSILTFEAYKE